MTLEVGNEQEKAAVDAAMADPATRAFVLVMGTLLKLPTDQARRRVLAYTQDRLKEEKKAVPSKKRAAAKKKPGKKR